MRFTNLFSLIFCVTIVFCGLSTQAQLTNINAAPGIYKMPVVGNTILREEVLWTEEFANGIPADWENSDLGGVAIWEYRGTGTTPNNELGTVGSCIPEDAPGGAPILSPTWSNGFVIFDSNFWDNPDNPCSPQYFGTGPAPAPHLATITTPSFDLTGIDNVGIIFYQYIKNYQAESRVEVSVNQGPWQIVFENELVINQATALDDMQRVVISSLADNQPDVRIRFVFEGTYYFWMIDDIQLVQLDENNMSARWSSYGDFDFYDMSHETGFEYMEYDQYPVGLEPELKFTTMADNLGANEQTNVRLNVEISNLNNSTVIHTGQSSEGFVVDSGDEIELRAGDFQMPASIAHYEVDFSVSQNEEEQSPQDNNDTLTFEISTATFARDRGFTQAIFVSNDAYNGVPYEIGNVYLIEESGFQAHSITAGVAIGTSLPAQIYGAIYSFSIDSAINSELLGITELFEVVEGDLNEYGTEYLITMNFTSPIDLPEGAYLVVAGTTSGADDLFFSMSGAAYEFTSWVNYEDELLYLAQTPMVRLNLGPFVNQSEWFAESEVISIYPNPSSDELFVVVPHSDSASSTFEILDVSGRNVLSGKQNANTGKLRLNIEALTPGIYTLRWNEMPVEKFVKY